MATDLSTFAELAEAIEGLPLIVLSARRSHHLSQRQLAKATGLSFSTISRIEAGREMSTVSLLVILRWLDAPTAVAQ